VEDAIPEGIHLEVLDTVGRVARAGQHVVPLQDLMQHDAVEEPAEAKAEQDPRGDWEAALTGLVVIRWDRNI